jgi:hypothetical protein
MIVQTAPLRSSVTSSPSLKTLAAMKKPTTTEMAKTMAMNLIPGFYHGTVSGFRKKD